MKYRSEIPNAFHFLSERSLLKRVDGNYMSTSRWQAAMAKASFRIFNQEEKPEDIRVPIAMSLNELLKNEAVSQEEMVSLIAAMMEVEVKTLGLTHLHKPVKFPFLYR